MAESGAGVQPVQIDAAGNRVSVGSTGIPGDRIAAGRLYLVDQTDDFLSDHIIEYQRDVGSLRHLVRNGCTRIKRVRAIRL